jgi:hypothetical protein
VKKAVSRLLLVLMVFSLAGYYPLYLFQLGMVKKEMTQQLKSSSSDALIVFTVETAEYAAFEWENESEFLYKDAMYDLVSKENTRDGKILLRCAIDKKEKELVDRMKEEEKSNSSNSATGKSTHSWLKLFITDYIIAGSDPGFVQSCDNILNYGFLCSYTSYCKDDPSPPPEYI